MAAKKEPTDLVIVNEFQTKITEAANTVPVADVIALEALADSCKIKTDEDVDVAIARAGRALKWADSLAKFWDPIKEFHFRRYKTINAAIDDGVELNGTVVVGKKRLIDIRIKFEKAVGDYKRDRDKQTARRQEALDKSVSQDQKEISSRMQEAAARGDMGAARDLKRELATVQPVVIMDRPLEVAGAAVSEPCIWKIAEEGGMMALVKAVAAGTVPLYHTIRGKGGEEQRCIFDISEPVMNQTVRKLGENLNWPGVEVSKDLRFAIGKR